MTGSSGGRRFVKGPSFRRVPFTDPSVSAAVASSGGAFSSRRRHGEPFSAETAEGNKALTKQTLFRETKSAWRLRGAGRRVTQCDTAATAGGAWQK